jgi:hypothetical protein
VGGSGGFLKLHEGLRRYWDQHPTRPTFLDAKGIIHADHMVARVTVNLGLYVVNLGRLRQRIVRVQRDREAFIFNHDNARPHTSHVTKAVIDRLNFVVVLCTPYSVDLILFT